MRCRPSGPFAEMPALLSPSEGKPRGSNGPVLPARAMVANRWLYTVNKLKSYDPGN